MRQQRLARLRRQNLGCRGGAHAARPTSHVVTIWAYVFRSIVLVSLGLRITPSSLLRKKEMAAHDGPYLSVLLRGAPSLHGNPLATTSPHGWDPPPPIPPPPLPMPAPNSRHRPLSLLPRAATAAHLRPLFPLRPLLSTFSSSTPEKGGLGSENTQPEGRGGSPRPMLEQRLPPQRKQAALIKRARKRQHMPPVDWHRSTLLAALRLSAYAGCPCGNLAPSCRPRV